MSKKKKSIWIFLFTFCYILLDVYLFIHLIILPWSLSFFYSSKLSPSLALMSHLHSLLWQQASGMSKPSDRQSMQDQARDKGGWQAVICTAACCFHLQVDDTEVHAHTLSCTHKDTPHSTVHSIFSCTFYFEPNVTAFFLNYLWKKYILNLNDE